MEGVEACGRQGRTEGERPAGGGRWRRPVGKCELKKIKSHQTAAMTLPLVVSSSHLPIPPTPGVASSTGAPSTQALVRDSSSATWPGS